MNYSTNPNPYYGIDNYNLDHPPAPELEMSDYLLLGDTFDVSSSSEKVTDDGSSGGGLGGFMSVTSRNNNNKKCKNGLKKEKVEEHRVAFRTKSEIEIMDDGFKWRKYGKKSVKNNHNPRNYYRCSSGGCQVKKRVERDREDSSYVITTYEGVHNHESPSVVYYNHLPPMVPNASWTFQPSHSL